MSESKSDDASMPPAPEHRRESCDVEEAARAIDEAAETKPREMHSRLRVATVVSVAAALVSMLSAGYSFWEGREQNRQQRRLQLADVVEKLATLQETPNDKYIVLARLTPSLLVGIEDEVSSPEFAIMARAIRSSGDVVTALRLARFGVDRAKTAADRTWALRQYAFTLFQAGKADDGNAEFQNALDLGSVKEFGSRASAVTDRAYTLADWEEAAATFGMCDKAREVKAKLAMLPSISFSADRKAIAARLEEIAPLEDSCYKGSPD
jgi:hypothetical protein